MTRVVHPEQGSLLPPSPGLERLNTAGGVVHVADLEWPLLDPEREMTLAGYAGEIGIMMAEPPRKNSMTDEGLRLFGKEFIQAEPVNLRKGLYFPFARARKSVVRVNPWRRDLRRADYPGQLPFSTGVAVSEEIYQEIVKDAAYFANQVDNTTQLANAEDPVMESRMNLGGESAVYALADKHQIMEARDQLLAEQRSILSGILKSVMGDKVHRVRNLEPYRLEGLAIIQEIAAVACKSLGYGTNQTQATLNAIASNTHRAPDTAAWWGLYADMAIGYIDETRGKVQQSIHSCIEQIGLHTDQLVYSIDREYTDG